MTNEEAKAQLEIIRESMRVNSADYIVEALDMAIKALEQTSEDCISRMEVLDTLKDKWNIFSDANDAMQESIDTIEALPPVQPQRKRGHWIDNTDLGYHVSICSNCDWRGHGDTCLIYRPKYCPNCGARMLGIKKSEDKE